ncbi:MAG: thioredoxin-dependent thiol peroxidase [Gemmatimonadota bacterium]|nr:thioredoxin-dependent thiol peroxidase [Gemmatimonadota bacterium]
MTPAPGSRAPAFTLPDQDGRRISLRGFTGHRVVLYFYPRDDTSGCTIEACEFRSQWRKVQAEGAVILGVSPDSPASHAKFRRKYRLPFTLLADEKHVVAMKYGVWARKSLYGRSYMGILRTTFLIDERGRIAAVFERVKPLGHATEVLAALRGGAAHP